MAEKTNHIFNVQEAKKYGIDCAIVLSNLRFWLDKNKANSKNIYDGRVWTYNSTKAFCELFPYWSEPQIKRTLKKLKKIKILLTGNYNKIGYDRTLWYTLDEPEYIINELSIVRNRPMDSTKSSDGKDEIVPPIPDINTDINTDINSKEEKASAIVLETVAPKAVTKGDFINANLEKNTAKIEIQNLPVGLEILQKMHVKSLKQLNFEINSVINAYPLELIRNVLKNIEVKMQKGSLAYFTPTYLRNAIDNLLDGDQTMDANVHAKVKDFCLEYFKRESVALDVYGFYRKLTDKQNKRLITKGSEGKKLSERKIRNIKFLVETYGEEAFLKAIEKFSEEDKAGTFKAYTLNYVTNRMHYEFENFSLKKKKSSVLKKEPEKITYVVPVQYEKREDYYKGKDAPCNWMFKCVCGSIVDRWAQVCPKCTAEFEWEKMVFTDTA